MIPLNKCYIFLTALLVFTLLLSGCRRSPGTADPSASSVSSADSSTVSADSITAPAPSSPSDITDEQLSDDTEDPQPVYEYTTDGSLPFLITDVAAPDLEEVLKFLSDSTLSESSDPLTSGTYLDIHGGIPYFTKDDEQIECILLSPFDDLGRSGTCMMIVGPETLQPGSRSESAGRIKPSGWHQHKYPGIVESDPPYLMNRCHLLMWEMTGFTSTPENLVSGTRQMNVDMLETELSVVSYIENTANHVLYRATPVFCDDELFARGILIEAQSVEDVGRTLSLCRFYPNIQEGILIDYATGENELLSSDPE